MCRRVIISWLIEEKKINPKSAAAAAAKLLQLCPTLCDPIDGSPPGSPIPGILQARTLEWVTQSLILFKACVLSNVQLFAVPGTVTCQAPLSMKFSRQNTGVGSLFLLQGIFLPRDRTYVPCVSFIGRQILHH